MRLEIVDTPPKDQAAHYKSVRRRLTGFRRGHTPKPVNTVVPISWTFGNITATGNVISYDFSRVRMGEIIEAVCEFYKLTHMELVSHRRTQNLTYARQVAMYLARELTPKSYPEIGRMLGNRDHSTVIHGAKKIARLTEIDARMCDEIDILIRKIKS